ncbi:anti-anti-sigma factor [Streptomyces misionensis]|uniref:Anti-anti-sigma factor n=1 Tax=Streptomyces misionensis TaxID=67331 RepID=A0A1H4V7Z0_9ACTN|nr:ANTAR domain-containing protein [Streptomyces misionensis]SEC77097.1 anti-anti-sigma factor [Streptomyces misionensis]
MTSAGPAAHGLLLNALAIDGRTEGRRALLAAHGELVHGAPDTVAETLAALPSGITEVELDLAGVTFMDTTGLALLDLLTEYGVRQGVRVTTCRWRGQPRRVLELIGLDTTDPLRTGPPPGSPERTVSAVARERAEQLAVLRAEIAQLRHALDSRPVIDQARGVLMAAHGCTPDTAWDILRETSQRTNTKLRHIAAAVIASAAPDGPPPPDPLRAALRAAAARHASRARV